MKERVKQLLERETTFRERDIKKDREREREKGGKSDREREKEILRERKRF